MIKIEAGEAVEKLEPGDFVVLKSVDQSLGFDLTFLHLAQVTEVGEFQSEVAIILTQNGLTKIPMEISVDNDALYIPVVSQE